MKRFRLQALVFATIGLAALGVSFLYWNRPFNYRLSAYVTDLSGRTGAQRKNIVRAADAISGFILKSGETFSFNGQAGPYTLERGFVEERSFRGKGVVLTAGGGICQVSSTLYNATKIAGLRTIERVAHSQPVESVPPGMDATVAYGVADLKFQNPYPFPIRILSFVQGDQLKIEIWGRKI